jgi:hypothetical protein
LFIQKHDVQYSRNLRNSGSTVVRLVICGSTVALDSRPPLELKLTESPQDSLAASQTNAARLKQKAQGQIDVARSQSMGAFSVGETAIEKATVQNDLTTTAKEMARLVQGLGT